MHIYKTGGSAQEQGWLSEGVPSLNDPDIRAELVQRVRREIAAGTYDTPEKFALALDRLLREID